MTDDRKTIEEWIHYLQIQDAKNDESKMVEALNATLVYRRKEMIANQDLSVKQKYSFFIEKPPLVSIIPIFRLVIV